MNALCNGGGGFAAPTSVFVAHGTATILIVDQCPANRGVAADILEHFGYRVVVAHDEAEALRCVEFGRPDLILLDAMMQELDSSDLCSRLKASENNQDIPVISMTTLKQTENKLPFFTLGAVDHVAKPVQVDELVARVGMHLQLCDMRRDLGRLALLPQWVQVGLCSEVESRIPEPNSHSQLLLDELAQRGAAKTPLPSSALRYQEVFEDMSGVQYPPEAGADRQFHYADVNPAFVQRVDKIEGQFVGCASNDIFGSDQGGKMHVPCQCCVDGGAMVEDEIALDLYLERLATKLTMLRSRVPSRAGRFLMTITRYITRLREYQAELKFLANHDALTGLPNRLHFRNRVARAIARAESVGGSVGVLMLDLDNFRDINDSFGRASGDGLLRAQAALLCASIGDSGVVARTGGDEFAILVEQVAGGAGLTVLARRLLRQVAKPITIDGSEVAVNCSVGVALYPADGVSVDALLSNVDTAMHRAKAEGRNRYQSFTAEMNGITRRRVEIGNALRHAIRRAELSLHFQPRACLHSGHAVGMEALLRWDAAMLGRVAPSEFIPVAEHNGAILRIGNWVLGQACRQARIWLDTMPAPLPVAVNLSARQFRENDLVRIVTAALDASGLPPHLLELELTESMLMQDAKGTLRTLASLKAIGVRLAIDDFGTGYSSLSYLKSFPLDYLKIDRSFISDLPGDCNDAAIVCAIIALAHKLGLKVIAEGVETAEQLAFLREQLCDEVQGYYFGFPLSAADMGARLAQADMRLT